MPQVPLPSVSDNVIKPPATGAQGVAPLQNPVPAQLQSQGRAMSQLSGDLARIAIDISEDHAAATSKEALNQWAEYADQEDIAYHGQLGASASEIDGQRAEPGQAPKKVVERLRSKIDEIESGLSGGLAKQLFRERADRGVVSYQGRLLAHEAQQIKVHNQAQNQATLGRLARSYAVNGDRSMFHGALAAAREISQDQGYSPEQQREFLLAVQTGMHQDHIKGLMDDPGAGVKEADEYLRGIPRSEVDAKTRQELRRKIDGVMGAQKVKRLSVDIVANGGYRTHKDKVEAAANALPDEAKKDYMRTAVMMAATDLGLSDADKLKLEDGGWADYANDPRVIAKIPEVLRTFDQEIIEARYPGKPPAGAGTLNRSLAAAKKLYDAGEIDAEELTQLQAGIAGQVRLMTAARNEESADALLQTEQSVRSTGLDVDDPGWRAKNPDLVQRLRDHGLWGEAQKISRGVNRRVDDEDKVRQIYEFAANGRLSEMTQAAFFTTFSPHLTNDTYGRMLGMWGRSQKAPASTAAGKPATIVDGPVNKWETHVYQMLADMKVIDGVAKDGSPIPDPDSPEQLEKVQALFRRLGIDIKSLPDGTKVGPDDVSKIVRNYLIDEQGNRRSTILKEPGTFYGWNYEEQDTLMVEDQLRRLDAAGRSAEAEQLRKRLADDTVVKVGGAMIHTRGRGTIMVGADGQENVPPRAVYYIRDQWRLRRLQGRSDYARIKARLMAAGAMSFKSNRDESAIETIFAEHGLGGAWPPIADQVRGWNSIAAAYSGKKISEPQRDRSRHSNSSGAASSGDLWTDVTGGR